MQGDSELGLSEEDWVVEVGKKMPDRAVLRMVRKGYSNTQVVAALAERGIEVTSQAVSAWKGRNGFDLQTPSPEALALIPWRIAQEDAKHFFYNNLQIEVRRRRGTKVPKKDMNARDAFVRKLGDLDAVVHYDTENGWVLVPRRHGVDKDFIREPSLRDDGSLIEDWKPRQ